VGTRKTRKKDAMQIDLRAKGVSAKGNKVAIIELCKQNNTPCKVATKTVKEGWMGKPKGMLQMLWERGCVDPAIEPTRAESFCTNDGEKDAFGNLIPGTSLRMMSSLINFIQERLFCNTTKKRWESLWIDLQNATRKLLERGLNAVGDVDLWLTKEKREMLETLFGNVWMETLCLPWRDRECSANEPGNTC
jgi:hypothetical protein